MRSTLFVVILALAVLFVPAGPLAAAGSGEQPGSAGAESESPSNGGNSGASDERILEFALSGNPDTLDPHRTTGTLTFQVLRSVYDTLVEPNREGKIVPALATAWEVSEDRTRWTFHLREGVNRVEERRVGPVAAHEVVAQAVDAQHQEVRGRVRSHTL